MVLHYCTRIIRVEVKLKPGRRQEMRLKEEENKRKGKNAFILEK